MKIFDCELNADAVVLAPFIRRDAEPTWLIARDAGHIPNTLFDFYRAAGYLSFDAAPKFLNDPDHILFGYFSLLMSSLRASLVDAAEFEFEIIQVDREVHFPGKHLRDPTWTREKSEATAKRSNLAFRSFLISLHASLDTASELIAIFAQGGIEGLEVGYSQFSRVEQWLNRPHPLNQIAVPRDIYLSALHQSLSPIVDSDPPETDWLPYLRLLRNKSAHLGHGSFRWVGVPGQDGKYYTFIPREWPCLWEKHMKEAGHAPSTPLPDLLLSMVTHQDLIEFVRGARRKVNLLLGEAVGATMKAYVDFQNFEFNQTAMSELATNSKTSKFTQFSS